MARSRKIHAAGAVVFRRGAVLLVHRPKYDDWSFPKGKLDPGESAPVAAVREVEEETGLRIRLCRPVGSQHYPVRGTPKVVDYWVGRVRGDDGGDSDDDVSAYRPNDEVDRVEWVPVEDASTRLTYPHDVETLRRAGTVRKATRALIVLRHTQARPRAEWDQEDRLRPLTPAGSRQAVAVAGLLAAYDVRQIVSSSSTRCLETVAPYASDAGLTPATFDVLSEEESGPAAVHALARVVLEEVGSRGSTVICSHRPVLPWLLEGLDQPAQEFEPGQVLVLHVRKGRILSAERH